MEADIRSGARRDRTRFSPRCPRRTASGSSGATPRNSTSDSRWPRRASAAVRRCPWQAASTEVGAINERSETVRIEVDLALCERQAVCIGIVPAVFNFGADGLLTILQAEPAE